MDIPSFSVRVLVNGNRTKEYRHEGRTFIEAKNGTEYEIDIRNHSSGKVLAIPSVDGLCTIDGQRATDSSPGFIIQPNSSMRVKGYTYNDNEVGAFKFAEKGYGYASGKGEGQNVGVIGVKFIGEKFMEIAPLHWKSGSAGDPTDHLYYLSGMSASAQYSMTCDYGRGSFGETSANLVSNSISPDFNIETTWGTKKQQKTKEKAFERGRSLGTIEIYYSDRDSLLRAGVIVPQSDFVNFPKAFSSYATPPKGWR